MAGTLRRRKATGITDHRDRAQQQLLDVLTIHTEITGCCTREWWSATCIEVISRLFLFPFFGDVLCWLSGCQNLNTLKRRRLSFNLLIKSGEDSVCGYLILGRRCLPMGQVGLTCCPVHSRLSTWNCHSVVSHWDPALQPLQSFSLLCLPVLYCRCSVFKFWSSVFLLLHAFI